VAIPFHDTCDFNVLLCMDWVPDLTEEDDQEYSEEILRTYLQ